MHEDTRSSLLMNSNDRELAEALQEIEDWGADLVDLLDLTDKATCLPNGVQNRKTRPRTPRRSGYKLEKLELEVEAQKLECLLLKLRSKFPREPPRSQQVHLLRLECEAMADRQRQLRLDAEIENTRLRDLFASQLKDAFRIATLARKLGALQQALETTHTASIAEFRGPNVQVDYQLLYLDGLVTEAGTICLNTRFLEVPDGSIRGLRCRECAPNGFEADFAISYELPFPVEDVVNALWVQTTRLNRINRTVDFEDIYTASNILVSRFVIEPRDRASCSDPSDPTQSHGQIATRVDRDVSNGSFLLVSTVRANAYNPNDELKGHLKGEGFMQVEPMADKRTRVKWYRRVQGFPPESVSKSKAAHRRWINGLAKGPGLQIWRMNIETSIQAVENRLLMRSRCENTF